MTRPFSIGRGTAQDTLPNQPFPILATLAAVVFAVEFGVMQILPWLGLPEGPAEALVDAGLLTILCFPCIYVLVVRPLKRAERALRGGNNLLEIRVAERTAELTMVNDRLQQEVADREQAQRALRDGESRLRAIVAGAADGIVTIDEQGIVGSFNAAAEHIFGYAADEVVGGNVSILMPSPHREEHGGHLQRYLDIGEKNVIGNRREVVGQRKDGSTFPMDLHVSEVRLGRQRLFTGIIRDIANQKQAEEKMRRFRAALDTSADAIFLIDRATMRFVDANETACASLGYSREELFAMGPHDVKPHYTRTELAAKFDEVIESKVDTGAIQTVHQRKDGSQFPVEVLLRYLKMEGGCVLTAVARDITERKQAEEEIERQNQFLNTVLESLPYPFLVIDAEDYSVSMANTAARRDAPTGARTCFAMTHHRDSSCDAAEHQCPLVEVKRTGKLAKVEHIHYEADGSPRAVEVHAYPVFDERKRVVQVIEYSLDITERKQAEETLRESEERLKLALEAADDGIWDWNVATGEVVFNERWAAMLGYELSEIEPHVRSWENLVHPDDMPRVMEALTAHLDGCTPFYQSEHRLRTKSGEWEWVLDRGKVVARDEDGKPLRATGTHKDITERKRADAKLEALHKQLLTTSRQAGMAEVAAGVLHNVGNVLNNVNVSATVVADRVRRSKVSGLVKAADLMREHSEDLETFIADDEKGKKLPGYLIKLAEHLVDEQKDIVEELHSLTDNIEHIKQIVNVQQSYAGVSGVTEPVRLTDLLEDALKINMAGLERHGIEIAREYSEVSPIVLDKHKLLQILVNLLSNAKYAMSETTRPDKKLTLRIGVSDDERVHIEVADNGVGITKENLTRIFSHGFTTKKDGHGFGLHNSALAATEMGASLTVHSDGPGKGATFSLELPLRPEEVAS